VPNKETGSYQASWNRSTDGGECSKEKSQLGPSRNGENMRSAGESIPGVIKEDQQQTEREDFYYQ
jgi:hypothetical protein